MFLTSNWFPFQAEQPGPEGAGDAAEHGLAVSAEHGEAGGGGQAGDENESPDQRHLCFLLSVHLPRRCGGPAWPRHHQVPPGIKIHKSPKMLFDIIVIRSVQKRVKLIKTCTFWLVRMQWPLRTDAKTSNVLNKTLFKAQSTFMECLFSAHHVAGPHPHLHPQLAGRAARPCPLRPHEQI